MAHRAGIKNRVSNALSLLIVSVTGNTQNEDEVSKMKITAIDTMKVIAN